MPALLAPALRSTLLRLNRGEAARAGVARATRALASFAKALKLKYQDIELGLDIEAERGLADSGNLDNDLSELLAISASASIA